MRNPSKSKPKANEVLKTAIQAANAGGTPGAQASEDDVSDDDPFKDFIEENREAFKEIAPSKPPTGKNYSGPTEGPTRFEDASICVDCRHYMEMETYSNIVVDDASVPSGRRNMLVTMRRCLLGAIKLPSVDEPMGTQVLKGLGVQAPIAYRCNKFSPYSDEELVVEAGRLLDYQERKRQKEADQALLEQAKSDLAQRKEQENKDRMPANESGAVKTDQE